MSILHVEFERKHSSKPGSVADTESFSFEGTARAAAAAAEAGRGRERRCYTCAPRVSNGEGAKFASLSPSPQSSFPTLAS